eukprot:2853501-Rhodomonas_salina.5
MSTHFSTHISTHLSAVAHHTHQCPLARTETHDTFNAIARALACSRAHVTSASRTSAAPRAPPRSRTAAPPPPRHVPLSRDLLHARAPPLPGARSGSAGAGATRRPRSRAPRGWSRRA